MLVVVQYIHSCLCVTMHPLNPHDDPVGMVTCVTAGNLGGGGDPRGRRRPGWLRRQLQSRAVAGDFARSRAVTPWATDKPLTFPSRRRLLLPPSCACIRTHK